MRVREGGSERERGRTGGREEREEKEVGSKLGTNLQSNKFLVLVLWDYLTGKIPHSSLE